MFSTGYHSMFMLEAQKSKFSHFQIVAISEVESTDTNSQAGQCRSSSGSEIQRTPFKDQGSFKDQILVERITIGYLRDSQAILGFESDCNLIVNSWLQ